ncbi:MAG: helix-turn-helix domain-containing protein [Streptosporangiaceae bacterium]
MSGSGSPTVRRRELGARLRELRAARGWTVEQVAEQLQFSPSKVSRLENGLRGVSARDIRDLCDLYDVQGERRQQLTDLAAEGKQRAWWQSRELPYSTYVGLEADAATISDFGLGLIPGLLQTEDYARAVLTAIHPQLTADVIDQRLDGRLERQQVLTSASRPEFEAVIDEGVLHRVGGSRAIMRAQLEHLLTALEAPNIRIWVVPYEVGILPVPNNKFIILSFREPTVPGVVFIEGLTGDLYLGPGDGLAEYEEAFGAMRAMAATLEASRLMISTTAESMTG